MQQGSKPYQDGMLGCWHRICGLGQGCVEGCIDIYNLLVQGGCHSSLHALYVHRPFDLGLIVLY